MFHLFGHGVPCSHVFSTHNNIPLELVGFLLEIGNADVRLFQYRLESVDQLLGVPFRVFQLAIWDREGCRARKQLTMREVSTLLLFTNCCGVRVEDSDRHVQHHIIATEFVLKMQ